MTSLSAEGMHSVSLSDRLRSTRKNFMAWPERKTIKFIACVCIAVVTAVSLMALISTPGT